jgi:hypothetical protein
VLPADNDYTVRLYNVQGRFVGDVFRGRLAKGSACVSLADARVAPGSYIVDVSSPAAHGSVIAVVK